ncbi:MAG: GNAT family N-acetyltransferase [Christensenellaceae bacterium]|jgi:RimJ/RimL family protein N-acetyltransferase|nr:GNAT family N-acetyltransferase [Christensenellaceae bacterium]
MISLKTDRLLLRNFIEDDLFAFCELLNDKEASPFAAFDRAYPVSRAEQSALLSFLCERDDYLAICLPPSTRPVGFVSLGEAEGEQGPELGYFVRSQSLGQGIAREACAAMLGHAFGQMEFAAVTSSAAAENEGLRELLASLGFCENGPAEAIWLRSDPISGQPLWFMGQDYILRREDWLRVAGLAFPF